MNKEEQLRKQLGLEIKALRKELRYSQKAFAEIINTSAVYLCKIEKGEVNFTIKFLAKISEITGHDLNCGFVK